MHVLLQSYGGHLPRVAAMTCRPGSGRDNGQRQAGLRPADLFADRDGRKLVVVVRACGVSSPVASDNNRKQDWCVALIQELRTRTRKKALVKTSPAPRRWCGRTRRGEWGVLAPEPRPVRVRCEVARFPLLAGGRVIVPCGGRSAPRRNRAIFLPSGGRMPPPRVAGCLRVGML